MIIESILLSKYKFYLDLCALVHQASVILHGLVVICEIPQLWLGHSHWRFHDEPTSTQNYLFLHLFHLCIYYHKTDINLFSYPYMVVIYTLWLHILYVSRSFSRPLCFSLIYSFFSFCAAGGVKFDTCLVKTFFFCFGQCVWSLILWSWYGSRYAHPLYARMYMWYPLVSNLVCP